MTEKKKPLEGEVIRKSRYDPSMCKIIVEVAREGGHVAQMCRAIGIKSRDTFYRWVNTHSEFKEAYEESKLEAQAFYESVLLAGALGKIKNYNFSSLAMIMNNKFPDDYKRTAGSGSNTEINIGSINSIEQLNTKQLDAKIKQLQETLGLEQSNEETE